MTTAILVDDERPLREYLQAQLLALWPELEIVGTAGTGEEALALAIRTQPDVAFLDIHMPGKNGLQLARELPGSIRLVFVTAFDQYAVKAFEESAVDYLLKPVSADRLALTVERLKVPVSQDRQQLLDLLQQAWQPAPEYLCWLRTGLEDTTQLVSVDDIVYFQAGQKYTSAHTVQREYLIRTTIRELERQLDPRRFWRIHRATIVRVDEIDSASRDLRGGFTVQLRSLPATPRCSRSYSHLFKKM